MSTPLFGDAVILCGGKSRRMGMDKSLLKIKGEFVINIMAAKLSEIFDNVGLCANLGGKFSQFGLPIIEDIYKDDGVDIIGPAAAIHAALTATRSQYIFAVAVDMPLLNISHITHMMHLLKGTNPRPDALIPLSGNFAEVLYSFYSKSTAATFESQIIDKNYTMRKIVKMFNSSFLEEEVSRNFDDKLTMFTNLNYVQDLKKLEGFV